MKIGVPFQSDDDQESARNSARNIPICESSKSLARSLDPCRFLSLADSADARLHGSGSPILKEIIPSGIIDEAKRTSILGVMPKVINCER